ncbi:MAG: hypothetical protein VZQ83_01110 [Eubacterium sp.]|nr:hypothetical protein [Eubacterium sp.]
MEGVDGLLSRLNFESREAYDRAKKEAEFIRKVDEAMDLTDGKTALKLYNKIVKEKSFSTVVGYEFMFELRRIIVESGVAKEETLAPIPVREIIKVENDTLADRSIEVERYKRLYEGQRVITTKFKIGIFICLIVLIGFFVVNMKMEYSVFTYFTNYKATMEEELVNKYQKWSDELQQREDALNDGKEK